MAGGDWCCPPAPCLLPLCPTRVAKNPTFLLSSDLLLLGRCGVRSQAALLLPPASGVLVRGCHLPSWSHERPESHRGADPGPDAAQLQSSPPGCRLSGVPVQETKAIPTVEDTVGRVVFMCSQIYPNLHRETQRSFVTCPSESAYHLKLRL